MSEWSEEGIEKALKAVRDGIKYKIPNDDDEYKSNKAGAPT
jgi:hypothetical protein